MYRFLVSSVIFGFSFFCFSQESSRAQEWSLQHDNDIFNGSDRYYTMGSFIHYRTQVSRFFLFREKKEQEKQLNFTLGQQGYTPDEYEEADTSLYDYPFSGWLFVRAKAVAASERRLWSLGVEAGVTGKPSLAEALQTWYHRTVGIAETPTWQDQIPFGVHFNIMGSYVYEMKLPVNKPLYLDIMVNASAGTKDVFAEPGLLLSFGKRSPLHKTALHNMIGEGDRELFGFVGYAYRQVVHNTLIEGDFILDNAPFTLDVNRGLAIFRAGMVWRHRRNTYRIEYRHNSPETLRALRHDFIQFIFARRF